MSHSFRIGCNIQTNDPFWVQLNEALYQRAQQLGIKLIPIGQFSVQSASQLSAETLLALDLDALIGWNLSDSLTCQLLQSALPIISLHHRDIQHPLFTSTRDLHDAGELLGHFLAKRLGGRGTVLMVGGLASAEEPGHCRMNGFRRVMACHPGVVIHHIPCPWGYEAALPVVRAALQQTGKAVDAIYGLSDSLALAGRDAALQLGLATSATPVVGINGDPLALAAIARGTMTATVDMFVDAYGQEVVDAALLAARGKPLPRWLGPYQRRLITSENVAEVAMQKLISIAEMPNRLVGNNLYQERQQLVQLETSLAINREIGVMLDRRALSIRLADLVRANYGYDHVQIFLWSEAEQALVYEDETTRTVQPLDPASPLAEAIRRSALCFVPDTRRDTRFAADPAWPRTRSRVVLPMRTGNRVVGLLDLHNEAPIDHTQAELMGLQVLADQVAIALRNAELVGEAVASRATAEKADRLKTQLLANVSHELRTPLNVIMGYSQAALHSPSVGYTLVPGLRRDLQHIYTSGEDLMRLINDLLDFSRAEIDELDLFPEAIDSAAFLAELFRGFVGSVQKPETRTWQLELGECMPFIQADPVRLRQILLNLLSNAEKFTDSGTITLGAELAPPHLHLWVRDTGHGIGDELQTHMFEPFVTHGATARQRGIGLGLSITRRLVMLHGGSLSVASAPGCGSSFHVYLPLPTLNGVAPPHAAPQPTLLLIAAKGQTTPAITTFCERQGLHVRHVPHGSTLEALDEPPTAIAWNLASAQPGDWLMIERLRAHPQCGQLPFLLFGGAHHSQPATEAFTGLLPKPTSGQTLVETIRALRPATSGIILLVDDDVQACELFQRLASQTMPEYAVATAHNGQHALDFMAQQLPSLVVLDLSMPEIDGFGVLARMRERAETRNIPVLVVSSRALSLEDVQRLNHANVTVQTKGMFAEPETVEALRRSMQRAGLPQNTSVLVKRAVAFLQQHHTRPVSRDEIAHAIGVSKSYLNEIFHQELGISPSEYLNRYRILRAKALLRDTSHSITAVAAQVGFEDSSYFGRVFHRHVGVSPSEFRQ